jgi:hypothetical protein
MSQKKRQKKKHNIWEKDVTYYKKYYRYIRDVFKIFTFKKHDLKMLNLLV